MTTTPVPPMVQFVRVYSLRRGAIAPREPPDARNNLLANISLVSYQIGQQRETLRQLAVITAARKPVRDSSEIHRRGRRASFREMSGAAVRRLQDRRAWAQNIRREVNRAARRAA
jgi:hypothetical protein